MFQFHEHHLKDNVCLTRPPYRNGKKLRAVKVYTIAQESKYLLIQNLPSIQGVIEQLLPYFNQYGIIEQYWKLDKYKNKDSEDFSQTILIKFQQIQQARLAKTKLDDMNFMGINLHICYTPEYENLNDLREKFIERRKIIEQKSYFNKKLKQIPKSVLTTNDIRKKMRNVVQKSNLVSLVLEQQIKKI